MQNSAPIYSNYTKSQLINYILGESTAEEAAAIERTMQTSPEFAETVTRLRTAFKTDLAYSDLHQANQGARDYVKQKVYTKMALGVGAIGGIIALVWLLLRTPNSPTSAIISVKPLFYPEPPEMILNDDACKTAIDAYTAKNFPLAVAEFQKRLAVEKDETVLFYFIAASLADTTAVLSHKTLKTFDEQLDYLTKKQSLFAPNIPRLRATIALRLAIR